MLAVVPQPQRGVLQETPAAMPVGAADPLHAGDLDL